MKSIVKTMMICAAGLCAVACADDDSFSMSPNNLLTFAQDTVRLDTVFSRVPSSTRSLWIYNKSGDGIRCASVRLENGNQTGFRVNVDGVYLSQAAGFQTSDIEVRKGDSIRVLVEVTTPMNGATTPQTVEDNLLFQLESGVTQKVNLNACSWDAEILRKVRVRNDSTLGGGDKPLVIYGGLRVDSMATLTIKPGTTLYMHSGAGIDVYGRLVCDGQPGKGNVTLRGDRMDRMFDYLPYNQVSGQWNGVRFHPSSFDNVMNYTDLHSAFDGVVCDSSDVERLKLQLYNSIIHNCQGYGLKSVNSVVDMRNSQITNTLGDCVAIHGGAAMLLHCTLAQFYPFDANRGVALRYANYLDETPMPLYQMDCINSIVTGYADDVIMGSTIDSTTVYTYSFTNSILRTPKPENDSTGISNVMWELPEDSIQGEKHFVRVDIDKQSYDFHLDSLSTAIGGADIQYVLPTDRDGNMRDDKPDIGCYEFVNGEADKQPAATSNRAKDIYRTNPNRRIYYGTDRHQTRH